MEMNNEESFASSSTTRAIIATVGITIDFIINLLFARLLGERTCVDSFKTLKANSAWK
jgi:hypothetical protein